MKRGTELLRTLSDGTCVERLRNEDYDDEAIYVVNGDNKIKFQSLSEAQKGRLFDVDSFSDVQALAIAFIEEIEEAETSRDDSDDVERARRLMRGDRPKYPSILFEGPIAECPEYRYRRGMGSNDTQSWGVQCIWDERQITCPIITTSYDSSHQDWTAFLREGEYTLFDSPVKGSRPEILDAVYRPTPQQWFGTQPECPAEGSVVDIDMSQY